MTTIAVIGLGAWGTALSIHAARRGHVVRAWAREPEVVDDVNVRHESSVFLPGIPLPHTIRASTNVADVVRDAEIVLLVPPSKHFRSVTSLVAPHVSPSAIFVVATKGIEEGSLALMGQVLAETMPAVPPDRVVFLSGPSFAREVAAGQPTDVVASSTSLETAGVVQRLLHTPMFRVYTSNDPIGVQVGGAIKNVIAIAAGASEALGLGTNARAALLTRGLAEMTRLLVALGGDPLTSLGLAGVGDLILTATGALSRNRELGAKVAAGTDPKAYLAGVRSVAEGFWTAHAAHDLAHRYGVEMPISEQVYMVLHEGRPLAEALQLLVTRDFKDELDGIRPRVIERAASGTSELADRITRLRPELLPLVRIAFDLGWCWQKAGAELFRRIDPALWQRCGESPVRLLAEATPRALDRAARNAELLGRAAVLERALEAELAAPSRDVAQASAERPIAFICAEYAIHQSLPIYAGGLGVLAGDFLKEASDRRLPLVAVGLLYRRGYFRQRLDPSGWQHEHWSETPPDQLAVVQVRAHGGGPLIVRVRLRGHEVAAQIWRAQVGRVPLYLLDTDVEENAPIDRWITAQLYVGDRELRLMQYAILGIGGVRALRAMGIDPSIVHLNEGHASLAILELTREAIARGASVESALAETRALTVFTTHTPVAAGNETYRADELLRVLDALPTELGMDAAALEARFASLGGAHTFGMTELPLRASRSANGVSKRHGEVARGMWRGLWPSSPVEAVPITHVTNGVHARTWMADEMRALVERYLGAETVENALDETRWAAVDLIPDEELWAVRNALRARLVEFARQRSVGHRLARGEPLAYVEAGGRIFDPNVLTIGFARRVAAYKRLGLIIRDPARGLALLRGDRPIQFVIAGKAHPRDDDAKRIVQTIFSLKGAPEVASRVTFLEDYDLTTGAQLVAGCDVWLNLPRPPQEASGTSGMKAALNGGLNLSVLDGWWHEAFDGHNGWAIDSPPWDVEAEDTHDATRLYELIEREVVPLFHDRDEHGVPHRWCQKVKASLRTIGPRFCAGRMVNDYVRNIYPMR